MGEVHLDVEVFRSLCAYRGWKTVAEQAKRLDIGRATIYRWCNGSPVAMPQADHVQEVLGARFEALFVSVGGRRD